MGWLIFSTRPVSMVAVLVVAIITVVISFGLVALPAISAFYFAVAHSRRERFLIDLESVFGAIHSFFRGLTRFFFSGYVVGILGLVIPAGLVVAPVLAMDQLTDMAPVVVLAFLALCVPAFFWVGAVVLYGYPRLVAEGGGFRSLQHALISGKRNVLPSLTVGFLVLFPVTAAIFHLLMVFSYPILAGTAIATTADQELGELTRVPSRSGLNRWAYRAAMLVALVAGVGVGNRFMGGVGIVFWLGLWFALLLLTQMIGVARGAAFFGIALGFATIVLGGGTIIARIWSEALVVPWVLLSLVALVTLLHKCQEKQR